MNRRTSLAAALSFIAGLASAQTEVSENVVGFHKVSVPANGGLVLVRNDLLNLDESPRTIAGIVGDQLPPGAGAFTYDRDEQMYCQTCPAIDFLGNWNEAANSEVEIGDGFWLFNAPTAAEKIIYISGMVPGDNSGHEEIEVLNAAGLLGYPFPVEINWTDTALSLAVAAGSSMAQWDPDAQNFVDPQSQKDFLGAWNTNPTLQQGEGFFITVSGTVPDWTEDKPYSYP